MIERKLAFVGFGNVARSFVRMIENRRAQLSRDFSLECFVSAIATKSHGCVTSSRPIVVDHALRAVEAGRDLSELPGVLAHHSPFEMIERCDADVLIETSPLNPIDGQPAIDYIRSALARRIHVVSANKGPVAFSYSELRSMACRFDSVYSFEGAVMDGAPVFNLAARCLPGTRVLGFEGVLNSTSNVILGKMESGSSFDDALREAQRIGVAEANPDYDIDGWDALMKSRALANVLMNAESTSLEVERVGIRNITTEILGRCRQAGRCIRPMVRANETPKGIKIVISPEEVPLDSIFGSARGTSNVLVIKTDLMGELGVFEKDPGVAQTAYALFSDLLGLPPKTT
jgi:homoserine dehydrogenase